MYLVDFSNKTLTTARLHKSLFGGEKLDMLQRMPLQVSASGEFDAALMPLKQKQEAVVAIPDEKSYIHRFSLPLGKTTREMYESVMSEVKTLVPTSSEELIFSLNILPITDSAVQKVLFIATTYEWFAPYYHFLVSRHIVPKIVVPHSVTANAAISEEIKQGEYAAHLDVEDDNIRFYFMDNKGPVFSYSQVTAGHLLEEVKHALNYFESKYEKSVSFLTVSASDPSHDPLKLSEELGGISVTRSSDLVQKNALKLGTVITQNMSGQEFNHMYGLLFVSKQREPMNILSSQAVSKLNGSNSSSVGPEKPDFQRAFTLPISKRFFLPLAVIGILVVGGIFLARAMFSARAPSKTETKVSKKPTPTPVFDRATMRARARVRILNGTIIEGFARQKADELTELGYKNISVDNADENAYTETLVQVKKNYDRHYEDIVNDLDLEGEVVKQEIFLDSKSPYDIVIILGSN